jgi:hypothetical protein
MCALKRSPAERWVSEKLVRELQKLHYIALPEFLLAGQIASRMIQ